MDCFCCGFLLCLVFRARLIRCSLCFILSINFPVNAHINVQANVNFNFNPNYDNDAQINSAFISSKPKSWIATDSPHTNFLPVS